ncbi:MAG: hypothetical protein H7256_14895 [Bdellovibrio sp.]|nr:hypothetical protein [Bdellovibrio sp.]
MKKMILIAGAFLTSTLVWAHPAGPGVTNAKAVELSAHRIDRLVALGKIDASFLKNLAKIEVSITPDQAPVFYKVKVSQTQPLQGMPMQVDISFDDDGKPLAFQIIAGGVAGPDPGWIDKNADTLAENCLHYILENNADAKIALFDKGLSTFSLSKGILNGETVSRGQAISMLTTERLNIYLKLDGTFISAEVIP